MEIAVAWINAPYGIVAMIRSLLLGGVAAGAIAAAAIAPASATTLAVDTGWISDSISAADAPSDDSPWTFTLLGDGFFRVTDAFVPGDTYSVFSGATLIGTSAFNGAQAPLTPVGDSLGEPGWEDASFSHLELFLSAGSYSLTVDGDVVGGLPATFYVRADSIPEPATIVLLGAGLAGLATMGRRKLSL
jgi:PEP-CTERM motif